MSHESIEELLARADQHFRSTRDAWVDIRDQLQKAALPGGSYDLSVPRVDFLLYDAIIKRLDVVEAEMQHHILTIHAKLDRILANQAPHESFARTDS